MTSDRPTRFDQHPLITLAAVILLGVLTGSAVIFSIYRIGFAPVEEEDILDAAFTYREASPVFHHGLSKNRSIDDATWGPITYRLRTNSLGFRDAAIRRVPLKSDTYRILFMGDSFTEGIGVDYENTFVGLIGDTLRDRQVEVLNAAAVSYSPVIYWRKTKYLLETVGLNVDEVVVFLDISDVRDETESYYLDEKENVQSRLFPDKETRKKILERIREDRVVDSLSRYLKVLMDFSTGPVWETGRWTVDPDLLDKHGRPGLERMTLYMNRLKTLLESRGIKLTVAVYPWPVHVRENDRNSIQATYWGDWCRRHDVKFINYFPIFIGPDPEESRSMIDLLFIPGDSHWSALGHELVARVFCQRFLERPAFAGSAQNPADQ
ncbi:MAG: hypothetical protein AB1724_19675 [Thermodesulfobacteriota bacterium]